MRKKIIVFFVLAFTVAFTSVGFAQNNAQGVFAIDSDLATQGYQGGRVVRDIGDSQDVGFAVYVKNVDAFFGFQIEATWDGTKAEYRDRDSGTEVFDDAVNINGADVALAAEGNILGAEILSIGEVSEEGRYFNQFAKQGGEAVASDAFGLIYFVVLRTAATFTTEDRFAVSVKVTASNEGAVPKDLGELIFYVNGGVDVKPSTWGEIKKQFEDF